MVRNTILGSHVLLSGLEVLRQMNRITQSFRYAKGSAANIVSGIRQFLYFSLYFFLPILPTSVDTLVCFLEFMSITSSYEREREREVFINIK